VIFSFLSAFIWLRVIRNEQQQQQQKGQMFKYFFVSSVVETMVYLIGSPDAEYYNNDANRYKSFAWKIWYVYFYCYIYYSLVTISNYMELAATFDCYIVIKNKFTFMQTKKFFKMIISAVIVVCFIMHSTYLVRKIEIINNNGTDNETIVDSKYQHSFENGDNSIEIKYYHSVLAIIREALPLVLLVIVNILILKTLKEVMKKKREIQRTNNDTTASNAELNKLKMIIAICLDYYILRTPLALYYILNLKIETAIWDCLFYYGYPSYILSYSFKFFYLLFL
jgi:hypothetical protein